MACVTACSVAWALISWRLAKWPVSNHVRQIMSLRVKRVPKIQTLAGASFAEALNEMQNWTELQLREVAESPNAPSIQRMAAQTMLRATDQHATNDKTGAFANHQDIDRVLDRTVGRPNQSVKVEGSLRLDALMMGLDEAQRVMQMPAHTDASAQCPDASAQCLPAPGAPVIEAHVASKASPEFFINSGEHLALSQNNDYDVPHADRDTIGTGQADIGCVSSDADAQRELSEPDAPADHIDADAGRAPLTGIVRPEDF